ncbi:NAD-dependent DNA ligase LigA [Horticoccus luteus]|uniref:DNA ligase n=2 Tax=Horticoccus luteus TaxID=2862869 RepID=A0A8F9XMZ1_9BACT|nr:NAD-dependent DNA ligase LigA [Horticoccus luteus]
MIAHATATEARQRIEGLRAEIAHHDQLYFGQAAPEISDYEYDQLKLTLAAWERAFPQWAEAKGDIGDDRATGFKTYRHRVRMLSLDKTYSAADVRAFHARVSAALGRDDLGFVIEPKFDGLAVSATYEHGRLVRAVTRGNGREGDDITANALALRHLPRELRRATADGTRNPIPDLIELRGEIYLPRAEFERINREREAAGETPFAHPRNVAAGTIKQQDPAEVKARGLAVVFYGWGAVEPASAAPASQQELHALIRSWALPGVEQVSVGRSADEIWAAIAAMGRVRGAYAFPTDGAVVKLDDVKGQRELGETDRAPRWAIAYKYAPERVETTLRGITIQVGRSGVLTPVAELAPVEIAGSRVARATLHNRDEIARRDLRIGDTVYLEKAGEIIPAIVGINLGRRPATSTTFVFPQTCPACGTKVVEDGAAVRCPNGDCPVQVRRRVEHFVSKAAMNIDGLGPAMVETLVAHRWVRRFPDLYRLQRADLLTLGGNVERSTDRLLAAIEASKRAELWRLVHGLGIPQVGQATAQRLGAAYETLGALTAASAEDLEARGFAPATAQAVADYFAAPQTRAMLADFRAAGVMPVQRAIATPAERAGVLAGKTFVLTGTLPTLTREEAAARITAAGGRVASSVSQKTDFVVAGEGAGAKLERARTLQIRVIDEAELRRLLDTTAP